MQKQPKIVIIDETSANAHFVAATLTSNGHNVKMVGKDEFETIAAGHQQQGEILALVSDTMELVRNGYAKDIKKANAELNAALVVFKKHFCPHRVEAIRKELIELAKLSVREELEALAMKRADEQIGVLLDHLFSVLKDQDGEFYKHILAVMQKSKEERDAVQETPQSRYDAFLREVFGLQG